MAVRRAVHWYVPTMMFGGVAAGTLLAVGHHLFYQDLNNQAVSDGAFLDSPVSAQQANIAIGTALAFLVKSCLVFAVGLAFIQMFWAVSHGQGMTKPLKLERIDSIYGAFDNFWALFNLVLWWKYPILLGVASLAWSVDSPCMIWGQKLTKQVDSDRFNHHSRNFVNHICCHNSTNNIHGTCS